MAQRKVLLKRLKAKLTPVTSCKDEIHKKLDTYVEMVLSRANSAIQTDEQDINTLRDKNFMLETVLVFLEELEARVDDAATSLESSSVHSESQDSSVTIDESHKAETSRLSESLKEHESKLTAIEDLIKQTDMKLSIKIENLDARTNFQIQQASEQLDKKLTEMDMQHNVRLDDLDEQPTQVSARGTDKTDQGTSRLDNVENRVKKLEEEKKQKATRLENLEQQVGILKSPESKMAQNSARIDTLKNQVERVFSSLQHQEEDIQQIKQATENTKSKLDTFSDKADFVKVMVSLDSLTSRVDAAEGFMREDRNKMNELENRISRLESNRPNAWFGGRGWRDSNFRGRDPREAPPNQQI